MSTHDIPDFVIVAENLMAALSKQNDLDRFCYRRLARSVQLLMGKTPALTVGRKLGYGFRTIAVISESEIYVYDEDVIDVQEFVFQFDDPLLFEHLFSTWKRLWNLDVRL